LQQDLGMFLSVDQRNHDIFMGSWTKN